VDKVTTLDLYNRELPVGLWDISFVLNLDHDCPSTFAYTSDCREKAAVIIAYKLHVKLTTSNFVMNSQEQQLLVL
jgi:hypothetical protein